MAVGVLIFFRIGKNLFAFLLRAKRIKAFFERIEGSDGPVPADGIWSELFVCVCGDFGRGIG